MSHCIKSEVRSTILTSRNTKKPMARQRVFAYLRNINIDLLEAAISGKMPLRGQSGRKKAKHSRGKRAREDEDTAADRDHDLSQSDDDGK